MLARYIEGWAEADPAKIADATAEDYDFHDPLVGRFSRRTLPQYFALLRSRFGIAGVAGTRDLAFTLRGPMTCASHAARLGRGSLLADFLGRGWGNDSLRFLSEKVVITLVYGIAAELVAAIAATTCLALWK